MSDASAVAALIEDALQVEVPSPEADLVEAGMIDSLALITLIAEIEREFGVQLPLGELELDRFRSAERIAALVAELAPGGRAA